MPNCVQDVRDNHHSTIRGVATTRLAAGRSIYFRDPDGHLLELATPGLWSVY